MNREDMFRRRLWAALWSGGWLLGASAAGCESTVGTGGPVDAAGDTQATPDAVVPADTQAPPDTSAPPDTRSTGDSTAPPDTARDTAAPTDTVAPMDTAARDTAAPPDTAPPVDSTPTDSAPPPDTTTPTDTAPVDTGPPCPAPFARTECMTEEQARRNILFPPGEISPPPDGGFMDRLERATRESNGCYGPGFITEGCCSRARSVARTGEQCCYAFCVMACCGRPLMIDGAPRVAALEPRSDWYTVERRDDGLDPVTARELARAWRSDALLEHASVASFARFVLQLTAVGAPPELLQDALRAGMDEVEHARRCLALAARYDGEALGPAALPSVAEALATTLPEAAACTVREGCVGETCSALLAMAQRQRATDAFAHAALDRIAEDEAAHAELSWRFVAWALATGGASVREAVAVAFRSAIADPPVTVPGPRGAVDPAAWTAHGRLHATEARKVLEDALQRVVRPTADALLGVSIPPPSEGTGPAELRA
ncbi:MAG: hypothetical protein HY909_29430 [Deltaproteobacteria bacterium]|nr:hypothetical protein [Deltaproteobacteria bacterium]